MSRGLLEHISQELWSIVKKCWAMGPLDRPTFDDLVTELGVMVGADQTHARRPAKGVLPTKPDPADNNRLADVYELQRMQAIVAASAGGAVDALAPQGSVMRRADMRQDSSVLEADEGGDETYAAVDEAPIDTYEEIATVQETPFVVLDPNAPAPPIRPSLGQSDAKNIRNSATRNSKVSFQNAN
jgi:hypothetical protein